jgi:hypothetical protein
VTWVPGYPYLEQRGIRERQALGVEIPALVGGHLACTRTAVRMARRLLMEKVSVKDLPKPKLKKIAKTLDDMRGAFDDEVTRLAEQARAEILPYFKKHDLDYRAGNGDWLVTRNNDRVGDDHFVHDDALPANIRELLMLEVAYGNHLGFYIRDIKRGEW